MGGLPSLCRGPRRGTSRSPSQRFKSGSGKRNCSRSWETLPRLLGRRSASDSRLSIPSGSAPASSASGGTPDAQTNGDYDGDGITDYGFPGGTDYWLNTTIPNTFPVPYAGRAVSVYIGPTKSPPAPGEDVLRLFLDVDNSTWSGYSIGGICADRLIEISRKEGEGTQAAPLNFSRSFPGPWGGAPISPLTISPRCYAARVPGPLAATAMYVEA